jgi:hypothetical protein
MKIPHGNTMENSGNENPKMGFKSPPSKRCPSPSNCFSRTYVLKALGQIQNLDLSA